MPKTCWTKLEMSLSLVRKYNSKVSATTTIDGYADGPLNLETLYFVSSRQESPWEGPYLIKEVIPGGAYRLRDFKTGADEKNP
jgi:hypothetical protein